MQTWNIDPDHTVAAFTVRHMLITNVHGQFNGVSGTVTFDPSDVSTLSVNAEIDAAGIMTGIAKRDDHLRSADFLDVGKYPTITFVSTGCTAGGPCSRLTGDLTIHGVTRRVSFDVYNFGPVKAPFGGETTLGFTAKTSINREDFGITWNEPMEGGVLVGKEVEISIDAEADLAE